MISACASWAVHAARMVCTLSSNRCSKGGGCRVETEGMGGGGHEINSFIGGGGFFRTDKFGISQNLSIYHPF